jgi:hypothetical protein
MRISRTSAIAALIIVLVLGTGLAVFVVTRPGSPASPGVANVGPTPAMTGSSSQGASTQSNLVAYSDCMRSHGVPSFPDPSGKGVFDFSTIHRNLPQFQSAMKTCWSVANVQGPIPVGSGR